MSNLLGVIIMTWYKVKSWKYKNYSNKSEIDIVESEKIFEGELSDIIYETIYNSVVDDMIDQWYGDVEICGNKYPTSIALKSTDPLVYYEMRQDICEMKAEQLIDELPDKPTTYHTMINQCLIYWE